MKDDERRIMKDLDDAETLMAACMELEGFSARFALDIGAIRMRLLNSQHYGGLAILQEACEAVAVISSRT